MSYYAVKTLEGLRQENIAIVSEAFGRRVKYRYERILCGIFDVRYREGDQVYIQKAFSGPDFDTVAVDDILYVETKNGNISVDFSDNCRTVIIRQKRLNINSLLNRGDNKVRIEIRDLCGDQIGTEGLVLVREGEREIKVGDTVLVFEIGNKYYFLEEKDAPKIGEKLPVFSTSDGKMVAITTTVPEIGEEVIVFKQNNEY